MKLILIAIVMFLGMMLNANAGSLIAVVDNSAAVVVDRVVDDGAAVVDDSVKVVEDVAGKTLKTTDNAVDKVL